MNATASRPVIGYCANVHAGVTWEEAWAQLRRHAPEVRRRVLEAIDPQGASSPRPMEVGVWFSAPAARYAVEHPGEVERFAEWLQSERLTIASFNGFPAGDFHAQRVKHGVYRPDWTQPERLAYSLDLAWLAARLGDPIRAVSISTVPLGWGRPRPPASWWTACAVNLRRAARELARIEAETGRWIHLDLEPEPGCALTTSHDLVALLGELMVDQHGVPLETHEQTLVKRHVRVCHDICHAAVMFEDQAEALGRITTAGWSLGKIQVSAALAASPRSHQQRHVVVEALSRFAEPRYLHQTVVRARDGSNHEWFFDDLPDALNASAIPDQADWRVHFHVPLDSDGFGPLGTTFDQIAPCLNAIAAETLATAPSHADAIDPRPIVEVETYTWSVLPEPPDPERLAERIAREIICLNQPRPTPMRW